MNSIAEEKGLKMFIYYQSGGELCLNSELISIMACLSSDTTAISRAELTTEALDWETPYRKLMEDMTLHQATP